MALLSKRTPSPFDLDIGMASYGAARNGFVRRHDRVGLTSFFTFQRAGRDGPTAARTRCVGADWQGGFYRRDGALRKIIVL
jgi:hypothetical protein